MSTESTRKTVRIGVYIPTSVQLLDLACVDIFSMVGHDLLSQYGGTIPKAMLDLAPSVWVAYITNTGSIDGAVKTAAETKIPVPHVTLTSNVVMAATHRFTDPEVAPGQLDIVLIPGPDPRGDDDAFGGEAGLRWLREHSAAGRADILSVCTGLFICGAAGLLVKGKRVCGPRGLQDALKKRFGAAEFVGDELRWVQDGNLWSSGGVSNGNDLVAAYARASKHFPSPIVELACAITEVGDRPQKYSKGQAAFTLGIVWQVLRAVFAGLLKRKG